MSEQAERQIEISLIGPGQVLIGGGLGVMGAMVAETVVGDGPATRSGSRIEEGVNADNRELFPYDTGVEFVGSFVLGAVVAVKTINYLKQRFAR